jgi:60 kDa SS-A/Ro ribonucleoprotein
MANTTLFQSLVSTLPPKTDAISEAGGKAHALMPKQGLATRASMDCQNDTCYADADDRLSTDHWAEMIERLDL